MTEVVRGSSAEGQPSDIYGDEVAGWSCNVSVTSFLTRRGIQSVRQRSKESQRAFFLTFGTNAGEYLASNAEAQAVSSPDDLFCSPSSVHVGSPNHDQAGLLELDTMALEWFNLGRRVSGPTSLYTALRYLRAATSHGY